MELTHEDVLEIIDIIKSADLEYFELRYGDFSLIVGQPTGMAATPALGLQGTVPLPATANSEPTQAVTGQPSATVPAPAVAETIDVVAPTVGTFYRCASPGEQPFVDVGSLVTAGSTVGLIEVMKMFTSVSAPATGRIVEIVAEDGSFVEYGQVLMRVGADTA